VPDFRQEACCYRGWAFTWVQYLKNRGDLMPKLKTHRGAAKRFSVTGTGKIKRSKANARHILTPKTTKRKRNLRKSTILDHTSEKAMQN